MKTKLLPYQNTIEIFESAVALLRNSTFRKGNLIHLDAETADDLMITADLHGNRLNFSRILELADLPNHPKRHLVLQEVCHGGPTYPNSGGCMSHLLLEDIAQLICDYPTQVHFIISNHELAELCDFPISKGGKMLNLMFRCGMQEMYQEHTEVVRDAYLKFLRALPVGVSINKQALVCHSLPKNCDQQPFDTTLFEREINDADLDCDGALGKLVWGRDFRQQNVDAFCQQVGVEYLITGHEPCRDGFQSPNSRQVIIDCCGKKASYMLLELAKPLSHQAMIQSVYSLHQDPLSCNL